MKYMFRIGFMTFLGLLIVAFGPWNKESRAFADDSWKSPGIKINQASCHPGCDVHYDGDPVPIKVIAPDGLDPKTARFECAGNGCQFDHGNVVLHDSTFIGTWYSRSEGVTIYVVADWKKK